MLRVWIAALLLISVFIISGHPALAVSAANGAKIFSANCTVCHKGGGNLIVVNKTLEKAALEQFGMYSKAAIVHQVENGKNAMPAFGGRLSDDQIQDVTAYILEQADKGWTS